MHDYDRKILSLIGVIIFMISMGTVVYQHLEGWRLVDALYFSTATLTTVGYGDVVPSKDITKIFTVFYILFGVGIILYSLSLIAAHYIEEHHPAFENAILSRLPSKFYKNQKDEKK